MKTLFCLYNDTSKNQKGGKNFNRDEKNPERHIECIRETNRYRNQI